MKNLDPFCGRIMAHFCGEKVEYKPKIQIGRAYCRTSGTNQLGRKKCFRDIDIQQVDWTMIEMVITSQMINMRRWTTKFVTGFCATGCQMAYNKQQTMADCPRCGYLQETTSHILQCPQPEAQSLWDSAILQLREQLLKSNMEPGIIEDLSTGLDAWRKQANPLQLSQTWVAPRLRLHGIT